MISTFTIPILLLFSFASLTSTLRTSFKDCNASQFDFFSVYSLGKQDQLNLTFAKLPSQMTPLPAVTYNSSDLLFRYSLSNAKASFVYQSSKQKGEVIGDDTIYISGGRAETSLTFEWSLNSQRGTGTAQCLSDLISFGKDIYMDHGFLMFKVGDYTNISYYSVRCNLSRLDPPLETKHSEVLQVMLNTNDGHNVKSQLENQIAKYYAQTLNDSLYDEKQPITNHSEYTWIDPNPTKKNLTINYTLLPVGSHLQNIGLSLNFVTEITDDDHWKCGVTVPIEPKDPKVFGGKQEYLSLSVLQNTVRYAVEQGQFDSILNRQNWQSKVFQFFAGDLYEIIPFLTSKYFASEPVEGRCQASTTNLKLMPSIRNSLLLSIHYSCSLSIGKTLINEFEVDPNFIVRIDPQNSFLNFYVEEVSKFAHFKDVGEYKVRDIQLANLFLMRSLERVKESKVFGSGWKIYWRDFPAISVEGQLLFIYQRVAANQQVSFQ